MSRLIHKSYPNHGKNLRILSDGNGHSGTKKETNILKNYDLKGDTKVFPGKVAQHIEAGLLEGGLALEKQVMPHVNQPAEKGDLSVVKKNFTVT